MEAAAPPGIVATQLLRSRVAGGRRRDYGRAIRARESGARRNGGEAGGLSVPWIADDGPSGFAVFRHEVLGGPEGPPLRDATFANAPGGPEGPPLRMLR